MQSFSNHDKEILRNLAAKQYDYSQLPIMQDRAKSWLKHNDLKGDIPMIHVEVDTFENEIIPDLLRCENEFAREIEWQIYHNILNHEFIGDDQVVPDHFKVYWKTYFKPFNFDITTQTVQDTKGRNIGHHFNYTISDLEDAMPSLMPSSFGFDREATYAYRDLLDDLFGDILPVKISGRSLGSVPTQDVVHMMGMETMLFSMYDYPELFHEMMDRLTDDYVKYFKFLEEQGALLPTTGHQLLCQGSLCYTNDLPDAAALAGKLVRPSDIWGFMDSQETVGLSPDMFKEFIFPYYKKVADHFGLLSYGCCEPIHPYWDDCISKLTNLRKVSISPWCDQTIMGEKLRDRKIIFHRKPSPNYLGVGKNLDEEAFSKHILETLTAAKGCKLEITQRDVYTLEGNLPKAKRYVEIIRELIAKNW